MKTLIFACAGSRGDVEPFTHLGAALREQHGHRIIIATGAQEPLRIFYKSNTPASLRDADAPTMRTLK